MREDYKLLAEQFAADIELQINELAADGYVVHTFCVSSRSHLYTALMVKTDVDVDGMIIEKRG